MKNILGRLKRKTKLPNENNENNVIGINENQNIEVEMGNKIDQNQNEDNYNSNANFLNKNEEKNLINKGNLINQSTNQIFAGNNIQNLAENSNNLKIDNENNNPKPDEQLNNNNINPLINMENSIQTEFKNIFQGKDLFTNDRHRKRLMYMSFASIIIDALILQILCLYLNICYGEYIEMQIWISNSIVPVCLLLLICYIILYFASDYLSKEILSVMNILIILLTIVLIALGIFSFYKASTVKMTEISASWEILSKQSKIYYYDNKIETLYDIFQLKMIVTGICFIILSITAIVNVFFSYLFLDKFTVYWRPPLKARLSDERAKRYIEYYKKMSGDKIEDNDFSDKEKEKLLPENNVKIANKEIKSDVMESRNDYANLQNPNIISKEIDNNIQAEENLNGVNKRENKNYLSNLRRKK